MFVRNTYVISLLLYKLEFQNNVVIFTNIDIYVLTWYNCNENIWNKTLH